MRKTYKTNIAIVGAGPAGYAAAMRALDFGYSICLIEKSRVGGTGIYNGVITSKTLWELSREFAWAKKRSFKYNIPFPEAVDQDVFNEVKEAIYERKSLLEHQIFHLLNDQQRSDFKYFPGTASFISPHELLVILTHGEEAVIEADHIILATGTRPRYISNLPIDEECVVTSDGLLKHEKLPKSLVIYGAGVIGCEFATIFSNFGKTEVSLICKEGRVLPFEDEDISRAVEKSLLKNGVRLHKAAELEAMQVVDGKVRYQLCIDQNKCEWLEAEMALISLGRVPNTEGLHLENAGLELNSRGFIVDKDTQTSVPHIYAVGDLTADISLVNVGELEGRHAVEKIACVAKRPLRYDNISTIMFLNPELAGVGMNEQQAQAAGIPYRVVTLSYSSVARAIAMRNTEGFFKLIVSATERPKVLGLRAMGEHASSAIQAVALLIGADLSAEDLAEIIHPHPSIVEGVQEALRIALEKPVIKPKLVPDILSTSSWNPINL